MTEHSPNLRALTDGSEWDKPSNGTCEKLTAAAAHIDAQDAKIKALVEALSASVATIEDYIAYEHDGDPWTEDARAMREMDIDDYATDGRLDKAKGLIAAERETT